MKYLKYNEARETLIDKKIIFLEDIAADMRDAGMDVKIFNGSDNSVFGTIWYYLASGSSNNKSKYIFVIVKRAFSKNNVGIEKTPEFEEFFERLKDSGVGYRFMSVGNTYGFPADSETNYVVIGIDKRSRLSRQEIQNLI